jgi:hypothetical protein
MVDKSQNDNKPKLTGRSLPSKLGEPTSTREKYDTKLKGISPEEKLQLELTLNINFSVKYLILLRL